jgi:hypothetical protein
MRATIKMKRSELAARAKKTLEKFADLESTPRAEALETTSFQVPDIYPTPLPIRQQLKEINGQLDFDKKDLWHCEAYPNLLRTIIPLRMDFTREKDNLAR